MYHCVYILTSSSCQSLTNIPFYFVIVQLNYMDPRISVAFCKRNEVPIEKVFSKTMRDKFNWAMAVPPGWEFNETVAKLEEEDN